jgi:hypothetical protein
LRLIFRGSIRIYPSSPEQNLPQGYTFDYENSANSPVGLSEYVVPGCSDTNYWGVALVIPIYVDSTYPAATYGL